MNRREFTAAMLAAGAAIPLGITRAAGQTKGGTLNTIIQPEPPILVTAFNQQQPTLTLGGKIYESLLKYGADLKPMPGMAQSWEISPDGLTYTFKLFPGITFHDGKPMTSEDVVFSCMKVLTETHPRARQNFARVASAEAPDPLTVVFKLKQPFAPFLGCFDCTSAPIVPKHIYEGTEFRKNPMNDKAIGTGPFKLKEWVRGSHVHLVRHDGYYRKDEPYLDEIIYRIIPDGASRALALENGTVQLVQWSDVEFFDVQRFKSQKNLEFTTKGYEYFAPHQWLEMNNRVAPMNDKRFRQAIMHLIDRDAMNKRIYFGNAKVATGPISSKTRFYDGKVKRYDFSVEKATALLDEMGLKPGANGKRTELKYLVPPYGEVYQRAGEFFRQSFSKAGIDLVLVGTDMAGWAEKVGNWDYEMTQNSALSARRSRTRRRPHLHLVEHQEGHPVLEHARLFQPRGGQAVRRGRPLARRGQAAGTLFQGAADPRRGRTGRLDAGARISDHLRQGVQEHRDVRDRLTRDLWLGLQIVTGTRSAVRIALLIVTWVARLVAVILVIATFNFVLVRAAPGDPAMVMAGQSGGADPKILDDLRKEYGLDKPYLVQLATHLGRVLTLDLGYSYRQRRPVLDLILERLPATLLLTLTAFCLALLIGTTLGALAGLAAGTIVDTLFTVLSLLLYATPVFWLGLMLVLVFSVTLGWLPPFGYETINAKMTAIERVFDIGKHMIMPVMSLAAIYLAIYARLMRSSIIEYRTRISSRRRGPRASPRRASCRPHAAQRAGASRDRRRHAGGRARRRCSRDRDGLRLARSWPAHLRGRAAARLSGAARHLPDPVRYRDCA